MGAGVSGLVAARGLAAAGAEVVVLDRSARPGGRLATRRIDGARLDHGAQFFSVRSPEFTAMVDGWRDEGCPIDVWAHGFAQAPHIDAGPAGAETGGDGHPRYVVRGGMNDLATHLARGLSVRARARVQALTPSGGRWRVILDDGTGLRAGRVVMTPPVPQTLAIVSAGGGWLPPSARTPLEAVRYDPCVALLLRLDRAAALPAPGGVQLGDGPIRFIGDNAAKGVSAEPALTVHLAGDVSRSRYADEDEAVMADARAWLEPWLGAARIVSWQLKRWRYSQPVELDEARTRRLDVDGAAVVFAGDAFAEAKIEGAARSGHAAATALDAG